MSRTSPFRTPVRRIVAGLTAGVVALAASVLGAALPASAAGTASISGTVTSDLDGSGVANVDVDVFADDGFGALWPVTSVSTDANGQFSVQELPAGIYTLSFTPTGLDHLSRWLGGVTNPAAADRITLGEGESAGGADVVLQRAGEIAGVVTDAATGDPIEGVVVRGEYFDEFGGYETVTATGADGGYVLSGLLPGLGWIVSFDGSAFGYLTEVYDGGINGFNGTPVAVAAAETTAGIDATLDRASSISGTVELASAPGVGVEGVTIEVFDPMLGAIVATTDANGDYTVEGLAPGEFRMRASGVPGALEEWYNGVFDENLADLVTIAGTGAAVTGIDFALDAPGTISGVITGPGGAPLEGVVVEAIPTGAASTLFASTDATGFFEITGVAPIDYRVVAKPDATVNLVSQYYPGVTRVADAELVTGEIGSAVTGISFSLPEGGMISGTVTDETSGDPLEGIEVEVDSSEFDLERSVSTDSNGVWTVAGLPTGDDFTVRFRDYTDTYLREFYDNVTRRVDATRIAVQQESTTGNIDAELTQAATVSGRVVNESGDPILDVQVYLAPNGSLGPDSQVALTSSDGEYLFRNVRPGEYRVLISDSFSATTLYQSEWFENAYDPLQSDVITISAGEVVAGFDVELVAIDDPEYTGPPSISVVDGESPGIQVDLPQSGPTPYGALVTLNFGNTGDSFTASPFDDGFWGFGEEGAGYDGHALVSAQAFGIDGRGVTTRQLVEVGAPPAYPVRPTVTPVAADGESVTVEWSIPESGDGVAYWSYDVYSVDKPGEQYLQSYFEVADDPFGRSTQITGLEPNTSYDLYVLGWTAENDVTYWGEARLTTTSGPAVQALSATPTPTVTGGPRIGGVLTATTGTWGPAPVTLTRQWLRDGTPIAGATGTTYAPTVSDIGSEISVRVTGSKSGYLTQSRTSVPTAPVIDLGAATPSRLAGADRYATAAAIAEQYPADVPVVYLATGRGFPDALSAASAAAALGGPLLITEPTSIPAVIADELERLNPARVIIVGGTGVVSTAVEQQVEALLPSADVDRHQGADRYATSRSIARNAFTPGATPVAYIATGRNFPDALAASAAAGGEGAPVILVNGASGSLDSATRTLLTDLQVDEVYIAGGTGVVSTGIESALRTLLGASNVTRLSGADRYQTAVAINDARFGAEPTVYLATGLNFPDALAGAALAGRNGAPLYVVPGVCVPVTVLDSMARRGATDVVKFGGPGVLTSGVAQLRPCS